MKRNEKMMRSALLSLLAASAALMSVGCSDRKVETSTVPTPAPTAPATAQRQVLQARRRSSRRERVKTSPRKVRAPE